MIPQTETLTAAARARQRIPCVQAVIADRERRWQELWRHPAYPTTDWSAAACNGALDPTTLVRVLNEGGAIRAQAITDPDEASQWEQWQLVASDADVLGAVAVGRGEGNALYLYYWRAGGAPQSLRCCVSLDDGASWGDNHQVTSESYPGHYAVATSGRADCWYIGGSPLRLRVRTRSGGVWGQPAVNGQLTDLLAGAGVAAVWDPAGARVVYAVCYQGSGAGNPWYCKISSFDPATPAWGETITTLYPPGANVPTLRPCWPSLCSCADGSLLLTICEHWTDNTRRAYDCLLWECLGGAATGYQHWGKAQLPALPLGGECHVPLVERTASGRSTLYLAGECNIRRAVAYDADDPTRRVVAGDVVAFHLEESETIRRGWVELANVGNVYAEPGAPFLPLAECTLRLGYHTPAGEEYVDLPPFWIETVELRYGEGVSRLRLHLVSGWRLLEQWHAPLGVAWANRSARWGLRTLLALAAGLYPTDDGGSLWELPLANYALAAGRRPANAWRWRSEWLRPDGTPAPVYQVAEGTSGLEAVWKLLLLVGGKLKWTASGPHLFDLKGQDPEVVDYAVGAAGEIGAARYGNAVTGTSRARVTSAGGSLASAWADGATAERLGRLIETHEQRDELGAGGAALAEWLAKGLTDEGRREGCAGLITLPLVPGLELWDRLAITDARCGLEEARRRVTALRWEYDAAAGVYAQTVALGGM